MTDIDQIPEYDPTADIRRLQGLDKLKAVPDPVLRKLLYGLHQTIEERESSPRQAARDEARRRKEEKRKAEEYYDYLESVVVASYRGEHGAAVRELARQTFREHELDQGVSPEHGIHPDRVERFRRERRGLK